MCEGSCAGENPARALNGASERTRRLVAKLKAQFLNSSRWARFQKILDLFDQHLVSNLPECLPCSHAYGILQCSSAYAEFLCKIPKQGRGYAR
jgi:hypothetical protein